MRGVNYMVSKDGIVYKSVGHVPESLYDQFKMCAALDRVTVRVALEDAILAYVKQHEEELKALSEAQGGSPDASK